jgi:hypothetical protein
MGRLRVRMGKSRARMGRYDANGEGRLGDGWDGVRANVRSNKKG